MSGLMPIDAGLAKSLAQKLESLSKSVTAAGYQGLSAGGKTGIGALAHENLDPVMRSITLQDSDFLLTKDIPTIKASSNVYSYNVKTALGLGMDLAGFEGFLPQQNAAQYMRVVEVLKVYGIRKSITDMALFINDAGGYSVDLEKENDENAALAMAEAMERDLYNGGDLFMDANGQVDAFAAANINGNLRQIRGIQANIREGDGSQRGIPGDFIGYGNNRSVVFDRKGAAMERAFLDKIVTSVRDSRGAIKEGHCTTSQLAEFRATFFPIERANIGEAYAIRGAAVGNDEQAKYSVDSVGGPIDFIPTVFKYGRSKPIPVQGSVGVPPSTPVVGAAVLGVSDVGSGFQIGEVYKYRIQASNISGISVASSAVTATIATAGSTVSLPITNAGVVEAYLIFRSPVETSGAAGTEMYIGKMIPQNGATTTFVDAGRIIPGLDSVLFMPRDKSRAKLATLGNLLNKMSLGRNGTAVETIFASYFGCLVDKPRSFAVSDNVFQVRDGI